ncbi:MAG: HlyD family efflux transporter periplasmic adaptor subunit [Lachnospiraceae bacterium]|nr:HlyD family efflux transporter periplasmic adaptor subunit [Lachnospiraceae bacterium]
MNKFSGLSQKLKKHKKMVVFGVIILVIAVIATTIISNAGNRKKEFEAFMNQTQTSKVERRTLVSSVSATGTLTSVNSKDIVVGLNDVEVKCISVELGDMVEAGQVICEFDSADVEEKLVEAKTALNVTNQKTKMDLTAAERNLQDAKEDYETDLKRANTDLGLVYNEYVESLEDVEEAESAWAQAKAETNEKKGELELRERQLKEAQAIANAAKTHESDFETMRNELATYITGDSGISMDQIAIDKDLTSINFGEGNIDANNILDELKKTQEKYKNSKNAEEQVANLKKEVETWQTKYNTAKSNESSLEKTYEQAVSTSQSKLQSYDKQKRTVEDTEKSAENNVINKTESLTTSQLNALSSGNSEEDKVEEYQQQLEDCVVEAPFAGVISAVNIAEGDTYNGTAIITIDDISSFEVTAQIDEYDIGKISKGQKVVIKTNATGDEELVGTVKIVSPKANGSGNEVTYTVIISVDTPNEMLRMDMTAKLSIILESKENVLTVPYEAVQEDGSGRYYVEVVDASGENQTETIGEEMLSEGMNPDNMPEKPGEIDFENMPEMPEGMDFENMPEGMDFGNMPQMRVEKGSGNRPQMPFSQEEGSRPQGIGNKKTDKKQPDDAKGNVDINTRKVYVEKGIESDYYIEIISKEITEGMEVVVPKTSDDNGGNIQMMMMRQGPMGGF